MNEKLTTYAALRAFYSSGNDIFGVFEQLIVAVFQPGAMYSIDDVQRLFLEKFGIQKIPVDVTRSILKRSRRSGFLTYSDIKHSSYCSIQLTETGEMEQANVAARLREIEREKNALLSGIVKYIKSNGVVSTPKEIEENLVVFIERNAYDAALFLQGDNNGENLTYGDNKIIPCLASYFIWVEKNDPENFNRLKSLLFGKVLSLAILKRENINGSGKTADISVYFDTNIIFSLMEFHSDLNNKSATEIVGLLKKAGAQLKVFSFTLDEIINTLAAYRKTSAEYFSEIKVDSIYYYLKSKGYASADVPNLVESVESKLRLMGIQVDTNFDVDVLRGENFEKGNTLAQYKQRKHQDEYVSSHALDHDCAAILAIRSLRDKKQAFVFEKSRFVFLTADSALSRFSMQEYSHRDNGTFPEVIHQADLTSILWLKDYEGSDNVFFHNFVANFARKELVSRPLWDKFIGELKRQKEKGDINESDILSIILNEETERILREKGDDAFSEIISDEYIAKKVARDSKREEEVKQMLNVSHDQQQKFDELNEKNNLNKKSLTQAINLLELDCKKYWRDVINSIILGVLIFILIFTLPKIWNDPLNFSENWGRYALLMPVILFYLSLIVGERFGLDYCIKMKRRIEAKLVNKCILTKKKKIGIE